MSRVWRYYLSLTLAGMLSPCFVDAKSFDSALQTLNQPSHSAQPYPVSIDENLTALYAQELRQVGQAWDRSTEKSAAVSKTTLREQKNIFFHARMQTLNAPLSKWIQQVGVDSPDYGAIAQRVLNYAITHPVASIEKTHRRARSAEIGYCFGRALLVHHALLMAGVPQGELVKVFALGELSVDKQLWDFHVAVGVRDPKLGILIIDPLFPELRGLAQWIREVEGYDLKAPYSRTRFYLTDPRKFLPAHGAYHPEQLGDPVLRDFFRALVHSL